MKSKGRVTYFKYFITIETSHDKVIWGQGRTRAESLKDARKNIREYDRPQETRGTQLKTYPTDKVSYDRSRGNEAYTILKNGTLILDSVLEEEEMFKKEEEENRILLLSTASQKEFDILNIHNKLSYLFKMLNQIANK